MVTKHQRRNPSGKRYAQQVNKAGDRPTVHGKNFKMKIACLRSLERGELTVIRRECHAEWRDGHRLIASGLVICELITDKTMYIRVNQPINRGYLLQLTKCLKGNTFN